MLNSIYKIDNKVKYLIENFVNEDGIIENDISIELDKLEIEKTELTNSLIYQHKDNTNLLQRIKIEVTRLNILKNKIETLSSKIEEYLIKNDITKVNNENFQISCRDSESIELKEDISLEEFSINNPFFVKTKEISSIDKIRIKEIYKQTGTLPTGIEIKKHKNITIK